MTQVQDKILNSLPKYPKTKYLFDGNKLQVVENLTMESRPVVSLEFDIKTEKGVPSFTVKRNTFSRLFRKTGFKLSDQMFESLFEALGGMIGLSRQAANTDWWVSRLSHIQESGKYQLVDSDFNQVKPEQVRYNENYLVPAGMTKHEFNNRLASVHHMERS